MKNRRYEMTHEAAFSFLLTTICRIGSYLRIVDFNRTNSISMRHRYIALRVTYVKLDTRFQLHFVFRYRRWLQYGDIGVSYSQEV
jgi:hypothetical protein